MSAAATEPITLRDYRAGDFDGLLALDKICFPADVACLNADLKEAIESARALCLVAENAEGSVAGFVLVTNKQGQLGHVITLDVAPEVRRRGIGERLMRAAETRLGEQGIARVRLEVGSSNNAAQRLYEKLGYKQTGFIQHYYGDGGDAWVMGKRCASAAAGKQ
jgi:ribosomal-protein-alanine N-acetyltransferase